jgi:outer membrane protein OmpA-like peptidoglycan-associated protein
LAMNEAPFESNVFINVEGSKVAYASWSLEIMDDKGTLQNFGPYTQEQVIIPGKLILGTRPEGNYKVTMIGKTKSGNTVKMDTTVNMVLWTPPKNEEVMRFSVIYEFDESKVIAIYERYLTDVVLSKIPDGGTVIIHGYTDIIGDEEHNLKLSVARANDVKTILENGLKKVGRTDVKFEVYGFGEDEKLSPFDNKYPEERFYNRTVIIDIVPKK